MELVSDEVLERTVERILLKDCVQRRTTSAVAELIPPRTSAKVALYGQEPEWEGEELKNEELRQLSKRLWGRTMGS